MFSLSLYLPLCVRARVLVLAIVQAGAFFCGRPEKHISKWKRTKKKRHRRLNQIENECMPMLCDKTSNHSASKQAAAHRIYVVCITTKAINFTRYGSMWIIIFCPILVPKWTKKKNKNKNQQQQQKTAKLFHFRLKWKMPKCTHIFCVSVYFRSAASRNGFSLW